jgi:hypothetical protein
MSQLCAPRARCVRLVARGSLRAPSDSHADCACRNRRSANVRLGTCEDRLLITGLHTVRDAFCAGCDARLGWKYGASAAAKSATAPTAVRSRVLTRSRPPRRRPLRAEQAYEASQRYKVGCYILEKTRVFEARLRCGALRWARRCVEAVSCARR